MPREIITICVLILTMDLSGQYFQQDLTYDINASYDTTTHAIDGHVDIDYTNNSPKELDTIFLNLWANAFSSKQNSYTDQIIKLGELEYYFADQSKLGGYKNIDISVNGTALNINYLDSDQMCYVVLNKSLTSGQTANISIDYRLKMPFLFDRLGWTEHGVQLVHWYPSIAVYNQDGWHPMEYLNMGELFGNIAKYKVNLDHPFQKLVSSGPIDGSGDTPNIVDFTVIADDQAVFSSETVQGVEVALLHKGNPNIVDCKSILIKVLPWLEEHIGPYPHKTLGIVEKDKMSGMEYSGVVTIGASDKKTTRILIHELVHQWFYGSIVTNQRRDAWLDEGFTTYYEQRLMERFYSDDMSLQVSGIHGGDDGIPLFQKLALVQSYRKFDQPLCTHINNVSAINYLINSYEIPARWIGHLENYLGKDVFDHCMTTFYSTWKGKHPEPTDFLTTFESISNKSLSWMFEKMPKEKWSVDYKLKKEKDGIYRITNLSALDAPYEVTTTYKNGTEDTYWNEGHLDSKTLDIDNKEDVTIIEIGPKKGLMDRNVDNNRIGKKPVKLVFGTGLNMNKYSEIYALPLINYNTSDGITAGAAFYNSGLLPKEWKFLIAPQYGFRSKSLIGQAWTSYDYYLDHPRYRKLFLKLGIKSYNNQYSTTFDEVRRYIKIDPTVSLHFKHSANSRKYSKLTLKYIHTSNPEFGDVIDFKNNSNIYQLRYESFNFYELGPSDIYTNLEFQPYESFSGESEHYLKLVTSYKKSWLYSPTKKLSMRLFGSYHILNTRRNSTSFNGQFTSGGSALIQQGFNDYTYEESWFNRNNQQQGLWGKQTSNYGGGFKTPLGSAYSIGQTNDLALALNFEIDLPIKLPAILPLGVYVDVGYFTSRDTQSSEDNLVGSTLVSGGLALNYGEGLFSIYIPLYNNDPIANIYAAEGVSLLGKISFRMDINRFNPWEIVEDYNY